MSEPSASEIAEMRAEAERTREPPAKKPKRKKRRSKDRVTVDIGAEGGLVTIETGPMRDREIWLGLLVLPAVIAIFLSTSAGLVGFAISTGSTAAIVVLLFVTASATHLRWTASGDCLLYKRNPRRPIWVGRCTDLEVETSVTKKKDSIGYLRFAGRMIHYYPLTSADTTALMNAARTAGMRNKDFRW